MTENVYRMIQTFLRPIKFLLDKHRSWLRRIREQSWKHYNGKPIKMKSGARLTLNPDCDYSQILFARRVSGLAEMNLARRVIHPGDTVIDVGANVGYLTTFLSQLVGPNGNVLAFEPSATSYDYLMQNLHINACENVSAYQIAAGDKEKSGVLYESTRTSGDNRMYLPQVDQLQGTAHTTTSRAQIKKLDNYASHWS